MKMVWNRWVCGLAGLTLAACVSGTEVSPDVQEDASMGADERSDGPMDATVDGALDPRLTLYNVVFVSSTTVVPGALGGIEGAHAHCQDLAEAQGLPRTTSYRALLSTSEASALTLLTGSRGFVRVDGKPFVDQPADLLDGRMFYPVALTERGDRPVQPLVVTGTGVDLMAGDTCDDWTDPLPSAQVGHANDGPRFWLDHRFGFAPKPTASSCGDALSLYCFGTGINKVLEPPAAPAEAGGIFLSNSEILTNLEGVDGFDQACQEQGGPEYVAFLPPTSADTAIERIGSFQGPWVRPDGVVVAESPAQLAGEELLAAPNQTALGIYVTDASVWSTGLPPTDSGADWCQNWTVLGALGKARASHVGRAWSFYSSAYFRICGPGGERVLCISTGPVAQ